MQNTLHHATISPVILIALLTLSLLLRLWQIGVPETQVFDEYYYVPLAESFLRGQPESPLHPPLGPFFISLSMRAFGTDAAGYRIFSAIAGILTLLFVYLIILKLTERKGLALLGAFLLSFDCLHFVMSRLAMLDIFLLLFLTAALVVYFSDIASPVRLVFCGMLLGFALLVKWAAFPFITVLTLFSIWREIKNSKGTPEKASSLKPSRKSSNSEALRVLLIPVTAFIIYVVFYCVLMQIRTPGACIAAQRSMLACHLHRVEAREPISSPWWSWLVLQEPLKVYERRFTSHGEIIASREVQLRGTPPFWYMALFGFFFTACSALRRRDYHAILLVLLFLSLLIPWAFVTRPVYLYYCLPLLPFMSYFTVYTLESLSKKRGLKLYMALYCFTVLLSFIMYYPSLTAAMMQPPLPQ
ncbi:MAG: phospholipid carrier-dependent glycosyltransferase [Candidatus Xenobiia bacterium LiM19]